eukprot:TRINITY_DN14112_c0_g1_i1.p1 TRINITY_DN14112_c0_g1~~TRINITY_DN14112_c0_g1_i1.p1  ORF type:complete len:225 (+),score=68.60 TRINITY_DN14112_c0_g1_i1:131-805(+)
MSIIYTLIARGKDTILVDYTDAGGNFPQMALNILKKVQRNAKKALVDNRGNYVFNYITDDSFTYMCMTDMNFAKVTAFAYLEAIKEEFLRYPSEERLRALDHSFNGRMGSFIREKAHAFTTDPKLNTDITFGKLREDINDVKKIMTENIDKLLEREEMIDVLVEKTNRMEAVSSNIKKNAVRIRREQYWSSVKTKVLIGLIAAVLIYLIFAFACGGLRLECLNH